MPPPKTSKPLLSVFETSPPVQRKHATGGRVVCPPLPLQTPAYSAYFLKGGPPRPSCPLPHRLRLSPLLTPRLFSPPGIAHH